MSLSLDRTFDPHYGEAVPVAPNVTRITAPNAGPMTFHGTNTYIVGEQRLAVVDPGPDDAGHLDTTLRAIAGRPVTAILLTHGHRDHSDLAERLKKETAAPILAGATYRGHADHRLLDGMRVPDVDHRIEAIETPGHSSDHLSFALPDLSLLLSGDHVMGWSTTIVAPPDGRMRDYLASLDRLARRSETRYLPGHGGAIEEPQPFLRALKVHRRMREAAILERLAAATQTIPALVLDLYRDIAPGLRPAAALSILAHLEDMVERGRVDAPDGTTLDGRYLLSGSSTLPG